MVKSTYYILAGMIFVFFAGRFYQTTTQPQEASSAVGYHNVDGHNVSVMTMTDDQRSIIVVPGALTGVNAEVRICPEPPADASDNIANMARSQLEGGTSVTSGASASGKASTDRQFSEELASIFSRSQGLELFRDGSNALCLAWLNDVYNKGDLNAWRDDFNGLLKTSASLIALELKSVPLSVHSTSVKQADPSPPPAAGDEPSEPHAGR